MSAPEKTPTPPPLPKRTALRRSTRTLLIVILLYMSTYAISDHFGSYELYHNDDGLVFWVWRGAYQWHKKDSVMNGREQFPSVLGVIYFPLSIPDHFILKRNVTLVASAPIADGVYYDYPDLDLSWNPRPNSFQPTISIPGKTSKEAEKNYREYLRNR